MARTSKGLLAIGVVATAALTADRFCTLVGAVPAGGAAGCGVAHSDAAIGDRIAVEVAGVYQVVAGAAVAINALVETDAQGRAVTKSAGTTLGRALEAATAAGDVIEVLLFPN